MQWIIFAMSNRNILKSTALVGAFTALSRVLGLVREMFQSRLIGAGVEQSAFALAFAIPNMARKLFGEGALTAAFVPMFKGELETEGLEKAQRLARAVMSMVLMILCAIVLLVFTSLSVSLSLFEDLSPRAELMIRLTRIMIPYMIFICGAAFGMGVLNAMGKFAAPSLMPCLLNIIWISALIAICFFPDLSLAIRVKYVSIAIVFAGFVQMSFMFRCMKKKGIRPVPTLKGWRDEKTILVWKNTGIAALGAGTIQINYMLDQILAQCASPWAAGVIGYAERLMDLPLGVIGVAFGTVLLPAFSGLFAKGDVDGARRTLLSSLDNLLFVMIPAAVGLGILAPEITRIIYEGNAFDSTATMRVSRAVACYSVGLAFFGIQKMLVPWFQAQNDMKTPLKVSVNMVFLNATLNVLAVVFLPVEWKHAGLAASTVLCAGIACLWLVVLAQRKNGPLRLRSLSKSTARTIAASAVMGIIVVIARTGSQHVESTCSLSGTIFNLVSLAAIITLGGISYFAVAFALNGRQIITRIKSIRRR